MSRYIVKNDVTYRVVIGGYPRCLTEIHELRIRQISVCHVNPQITLRHLWSVPCFSYKHTIFLPNERVCVCLIHTRTFHWNSHFFARYEVLTELFLRILLLGENVPSAEIHHRLQQQYGEECLRRRHSSPYCCWLHSLKVAQLLRSAACLHTNQSLSYLNHLVLPSCSFIDTRIRCRIPMVNEWIRSSAGMKTDCRKPKYLYRWHFVYQKFHVNYPRMSPGHPCMDRPSWSLINVQNKLRLEPRPYSAPLAFFLCICKWQNCRIVVEEAEHETFFSIHVLSVLLCKVK